MTYFIQVSICWILFYMIYQAFLNKETYFDINRYYLLMGLVSGLLLPVISKIMPVNAASVEIYTAITAISISDVEVTSNTPLPFSWIQILTYIYFIGIFIVGSRFLYGLYKIYEIYKTANVTKYERFVLVNSNISHLPFSFFNHVFISDKVPYTREYDIILQHESLHVTQWHSLDIILSEILQIIFWFNPILILYKKALREIHEYLADAYTTMDHNKNKYSKLLLGQTSSGLELALANQFFRSQIKKRIDMMHKEKSKKQALAKYLTAIPVLILMVFIFASNANPRMVSNLDTQSILKPIVSQGDKILIKDIDYMLDSQKGTLRVSDKYIKNGEAINVNFEPSDTIRPEIELYKVVEEMPRFPGCEDLAGTKREKEECGKNKMIEFVYANVKYPEDAKKASIEGMVVIQFTILKDGRITDAKIVRNIEGGCGQEALRVVNTMPKWIPGRQNGKAVNVQYVLPIKFKLSDDQTDAMPLFPTPPPPTAPSPPSPPSPPNDEIYKVVEEMPRFPGCEDKASLDQKENCAREKMLEFIYENVKYPEEAKKASIEGIVVLQFTILKDGRISEAKIIREVGGGCGQEALRVINTMPTWIPGKQKGNAVSVLYTLPVKFKLDSATKKEK